MAAARCVGAAVLRHGAGLGSVAAGRPAEPSNSHTLGLRVGDRVEHGTFGEGIIIDISGSGDKTEAVVNFSAKGTKHLLLAWAPLKKL